LRHSPTGRPPILTSQYSRPRAPGFPHPLPRLASVGNRNPVACRRAVLQATGAAPDHAEAARCEPAVAG